MNIWHDVDPNRIHPENFIAVVEINQGCKNKYELDKATGRLILDRVLYTSTHYPQNYGFIPRTYAGDNDPLDVLILCSESIIPLTLVRCHPIGVFKMMDGGEVDEKIIAIAQNDPTYSAYETIEELPAHIFQEIRHFFQVYKTLEGKETVVHQVEGREAAIASIRASMAHYDEVYGKK